MAVVLLNAFSLNMLERKEYSIAFKPVAVEEVKETLSGGFISYIGHQDLASVLSSMLGVEVPVNRANYKIEPEDIVVVAQYTGPRLPEGATKLPENASIEFWRVAIEAEEF